MASQQDLNQSLAQNAGGGAALVYATGENIPPALAEALKEHYEQIKRRVVYTAMALAALAVIDRTVSYVLNVQEAESFMGDMQEVFPREKLFQGLPQAGDLLVGGLPKLLWGILTYLLVPACGWLGARWGNSKLTCCFCGCNLIAACCALVGVLMCTAILSSIDSVEPVVENWLADCDPTLCTSPALHLSRNQTIDCLAAPAPGYHTKYGGSTPHLEPGRCASLFLTCKVDPAWTKFCAGQGDKMSCKHTDDLCVWIPKPPKAGGHHSGEPGSCIPLDQSAIAERIEDAIDRARREEERKEEPRRALMAAHGRGFMAHGDGYDERRPPAITAAAATGTERSPLELPRDPQADCEVDEKRVEAFDAARQLVPKLLPLVQLCAAVRLALLVPAAVLGCLGFWWGKELWHKLNAGYALVAAPPRAAYAREPAFAQPPPQGVAGLVAGLGAPPPYGVVVQPREAAIVSVQAPGSGI